jgi:(2Fe-2S) ferredoxin
MLPERHIFVCNHGKSCAKVGSAEVYAKFRELLKASGMKPRVAVTGCGSLGFCDRGVAVAIYPEQIWYSRVTESDVEEIWREHVLNGRVVERLRDEMDCPMPDDGPAPFQG